MAVTPLITVIVPVYRPPLGRLKAALGSIVDQTFEDWEAVVVDDASAASDVDALIDAFVGRDERFRAIRHDENRGISAASNSALACARGRYVALLDHDDELHPAALEHVATVIDACPEVDFVYTDEEIVDEKGRSVAVLQKPGWSPERMRSVMYTGHLAVLRTEAVRMVGGFDSAFDGAQDYDLVLRVTEQAHRIVHIPRVLYRWVQAPGSVSSGEGEKPWAYAAGTRAVQAHCDRVGIDATVEDTDVAGVHHVRRRVKSEELVSIVIPTRATEGRAWGRVRVHVEACVSSILDRSTYPNFEIVVVADADSPENEIRGLIDKGRGRVRIEQFREPFNFSHKCNLGAFAAAGSYLLFLNDDTEVITPMWIEELLGPLQDADVAMSGAKLLFPDGTVQHAGQAFHGIPMHCLYRSNDEEVGDGFALRIARECSGVTAACALIKREDFERVGGFTPELPSNYNDVDLALKLRALGRRIVWTPHARLWHFESASRDPSVTEHDAFFIRDRWGAVLFDDPYYTPNSADPWSVRALEAPHVRRAWRESSVAAVESAV